jgi:Leucine-rich repeat (LRR) protein
MILPALYIFPFLISCEIRAVLGCDATEISLLMYATFENRTDIPQHHIGRTINEIPDDIFIELDLLNNTFLCKSMFGGLYKLKLLSVTSPELTDLEADFLEGQQVEEDISITFTSVRTIKKHTFNSLKILKLELTWNKIKTLEDESIVNLPRLRYLYLSYNQIARLRPESFDNLPQLYELNLMQNRIFDISENFFRFLRQNNVQINLSHNELYSLDRAFVALTADNVFLFLSYNHLKYLSAEIFEGPHFTQILVTHNYISSISTDFFQNDIHVDYLDMSFNPLDNETLQNLRIWATDNNRTFYCSLCAATSIHKNGIFVFVVIFISKLLLL